MAEVDTHAARVYQGIHTIIVQNRLESKPELRKILGNIKTNSISIMNAKEDFVSGHGNRMELFRVK